MHAHSEINTYMHTHSQVNLYFAVIRTHSNRLHAPTQRCLYSFTYFFIVVIDFVFKQQKYGNMCIFNDSPSNSLANEPSVVFCVNVGPHSKKKFSLNDPTI